MNPNTRIIPCNSRTHAFAGNPLTVANPKASFAALRHLLQKSPQQLQPDQTIKILPFFHNKPLISSPTISLFDEIPSWHLAWKSLYKCRQILHTIDGDDLEISLVYLGHAQGEEETMTMYWALDLNAFNERALQFVSISEQTAFVDARTLMIGTLISNQVGMAELSIAGQPGESIEEAVRRETREEIGIEVDEVVYHSSQPWPVGPASMPCQLMMGFLAFAKSFDIHVDKNELEDAKWYGREEVKKILDFKQHVKDQKTSAFRINKLCAGLEKGKGSLPDVKRMSEGPRGTAPMFVPGPYAIAHHLISSWVNCSHDSLLSRL